jgi:hypothetical protein
VTPRYHYLEVTGGPAPRRIDMPTTTYRPLNRPRPGAPLVVQLGWTSLGAVDLATGALRTDTSRNLGDVHHLVVGGGVVYAAADRLRRWERGALVASTDLAAEALAGHPPLGPIWLVADDTLLAWDGSAGAPRSLAEASAADIIDASPTEAIFTNLYDLYRVRPGAAPERWFTFHEDAYLADLDASTGRLLLSTDGGVSIVAPDEERVIGVANDDCWSPSFPRLARGIERAVIDAEAAVRVYDTASGRLVGSLDTADTVTLDAEFLGPDAGTLAVLIEDAVLLWPIGAARAARWTLPLTASPVTLAASSDGLELAIGFDDGSLAWTTVADARAAATSLRVHAAAAPTACDDGSTAVTTLDDLRGTSLEDEDDEDDWCDGGDCGAE